MPNNYPARQDSHELFARIFAQHEPALRSFVRPLVPTRDDLDEVIQQTCLVLWRKFAAFEIGTNFLAWACTIARFEALKHRKLAYNSRKFTKEMITLLAGEGAAETARRECERRALDASMQQLPQSQRELIRQCYSGKATIKEVARAQGRSATALYKALHRIRRRLLDCIERALAQDR